MGRLRAGLRGVLMKRSHLLAAGAAGAAGAGAALLGAAYGIYRLGF